MSATADSGAFIKAQDLQFATVNLEPYLYSLLFKIPCEGKEVDRCISLARALCRVEHSTYRLRPSRCGRTSLFPAEPLECD